jgi:hypothetical protein
MHTLEDVIPNFLIFEEKIVAFKGVGEILFNPLRGIIPLVAYLCFGLWLRKKRISRDEHLLTWK